MKASCVELAAVMVTAWCFADYNRAADLEETYKEYIQQIQVAPDIDRLKAWIRRFETEVAGSDPKSPAFYHALLVLGELYEKTGDRASSIKIHDGILRSEAAPELLRVQAGLAEVFVRERLPASSAELLDLSDQIDKLLAKSDLGASADAFTMDVRLLRFKRIQWRLAVTKEQMDQASAEDQKPQRTDRRLKVLRDASGELERYLADWPKLSDPNKRSLNNLNVGPDAAMYLQGEVEYTRATALLGVGQKDDAAASFATAFRCLTELLAAYPRNTHYSHPAAVLLLSIKEATPDKAYIQYARELVPQLTPGHTVINFLSDSAMRLSSGKTRRAAVGLFDLVIAQERLWFPNEYERHINYQVALLESTVNLIAVDDLKGASERLGIIRQTPITDTHLQKRVQQIAELYGQRLARGSFALDSPTTGPSESFLWSISLGGLLLVVLYFVKRRRVHVQSS